MQFGTIALTALAFAQAAFAASGSKEFGTLAILSGSSLQYSCIVAEGDDLYFDHTYDALLATITDCGFLQFKDGSYAYVDTGGSFKKGPRGNAIPGFKVTDGNLKYNDNDLFGVKDGDQYKVFSKATDNDSHSVLLRALDAEDAAKVVPDYTPDGKDCAATGPPASVTKRDVASVSSANGAAQLGSQASFGMGAAAAVAAFLL